MVNITDDMISEYFKYNIRGEMYDEIERCIKAKAALAVASILMAYTETIGALITGKLGDSSGGKEFNYFLNYFEFNGNKDHYKNFAFELRSNKKSGIERIDIYRAFRCGLMHEGFPKVPWYIRVYKLSEKKKYAGVDCMPEKGKKVFLFQANAYFSDFKKAVDKIEVDKDLIEPIKKSLKRIYEREVI